MARAIKRFFLSLFGRGVDGRCKYCGAEALIWTDGGKIVCTKCDQPQWG
jgi:hypothetical protein